MKAQFLVSYREPKFSKNELHFCETLEEARGLIAEYSNDLPAFEKYSLQLIRLEYLGGSCRGDVGL